MSIERFVFSLGSQVTIGTPGTTVVAKQPDRNLVPNMVMTNAPGPGMFRIVSLDLGPNRVLADVDAHELRLSSPNRRDQWTSTQVRLMEALYGFTLRPEMRARLEFEYTGSAEFIKRDAMSDSHARTISNTLIRGYPFYFTLAVQGDGQVLDGEWSEEAPLLSPSMVGWDRAWAVVHAKYGNVVSIQHRDQWQYMGSEGGVHAFRHRNYDGKRLYEHVPVLEGDFAEKES